MSPPRPQASIWAIARVGSDPSARLSSAMTSSPWRAANGATVVIQRTAGLERISMRLNHRRPAMERAWVLPLSLKGRTASSSENDDWSIAWAWRIRYTVTRAMFPTEGLRAPVEGSRRSLLLVGFFERNRLELAAKGIDLSRLPPGQYATERFPVLTVGDVPHYRSPDDWSLEITGLVESPLSLGFDELCAMTAVTMTADIHCVTKWSKFDTTWTGVRLSDLLDLAGVRPDATHVIQHAEYGYSTNLALEQVRQPDVLVAYAYEGQPLDPEHGAPVRTVVPHRYFWKSAKWLRALEVTDEDHPGFWEENGYHNDGDPFGEQRHSAG